MQDLSEFNISFVKLVEQQPCLYDSTVEDYYRGYVQDKAWETIAQTIGTNVTVKECKARWRNLRGRFTKHLKSHASSNPAESSKRPYYLAEHLSYLLPFTKPKKSQAENDAPYLEDSISRFLEIDSSISDQIIEGEELEPNEEIEFKYQFREPSETDKSERFDHGSGSSNKRDAPVHSDSHLMHEKYRRLDGSGDFPCEVKRSHQTQNTIDYSDSDVLFLMSLLPDLKRMNDYQKRKYKIGILRMGGEILNEHPAAPSASSCQRTTRRNSSSSYMSPDSGVSRTHQGHVRPSGNGESNENSTSN
ncbi:uncharacterized protein LOC135698567 [Ochlerotatus camptorhynchus]|uniref:uncharacterized protein LOC135698567 n=1 Tax=Ochlerotatus camptorhynchus TaxID=644619 RepID=UPI0031D8A3BB